MEPESVAFGTSTRTAEKVQDYQSVVLSDALIEEVRTQSEGGEFRVGVARIGSRVPRVQMVECVFDGAAYLCDETGKAFERFVVK